MTTYDVDIGKLSAQWGRDPIPDAIEEFFSTEVSLPGNEPRLVPTHLFGNGIRIIPVGDDKSDTGGVCSARGDTALARSFSPGEIGYQLHFGRLDRRRSLRHGVTPEEMYDHLRLRCDHVGFVVGLDERDGAAGVATFHNPQNYPRARNEVFNLSGVGRFGCRQPSGATIYFKPRFPTYVRGAMLQEQFAANIRTMMLGFNAVSKTPPLLDGDLLGASAVESTGECVRQMIVAIAGEDREAGIASEWFDKLENRLYCSELVHLATTAGLHFPLNAATATLVGVPPRVWRRFIDAIENHQSGLCTRFTKYNLNPYARNVKLSIADERLRPIASYAPSSIRNNEARKLAFPARTAPQLAESTLEILLGSGRRQPGIVDHLSPGFTQWLTKKLGGVWRTADEESTSREIVDLSGKFVPPSLLLHVAHRVVADRLLDLEYIGHGVPYGCVKAKALVSH